MSSSELQPAPDILRRGLGHEGEVGADRLAVTLADGGGGASQRLLALLAA